MTERLQLPDSIIDQQGVRHALNAPILENVAEVSVIVDYSVGRDIHSWPNNIGRVYVTNDVLVIDTGDGNIYNYPLYRNVTRWWTEYTPIEGKFLYLRDDKQALIEMGYAFLDGED